jgi:hypothetical protein
MPSRRFYVVIAFIVGICLGAPAVGIWSSRHDPDDDQASYTCTSGAVKQLHSLRKPIEAALPLSYPLDDDSDCSDGGEEGSNLYSALSYRQVARRAEQRLGCGVAHRSTDSVVLRCLSRDVSFQLSLEGPETVSAASNQNTYGFVTVTRGRVSE